MGAAPVLDDAEPAGGDLVDHPVVEGDYAVSHVLLETVAGEGRLPGLAGDDGGDPPVLEPRKQPAQLRPEHRVVHEPGEEHLHGVERHPFRPDGVDGKAQADEQPLQVVFAGLLDLGRIDMDMVDHHLFLVDQAVYVKPEGCHVFREVRGRLLECHEDARLIVLGGPPGSRP